jgi:cobalt-precorrin 5A hydrolase/precorrin-3B C17-methyltransferase
VRDADRPEQSVRLGELGELSPDSVDMKTVVVVGNSTTVRLGDRLVTRRGYLSSRRGDQ